MTELSRRYRASLLTLLRGTASRSAARLRLPHASLRFHAACTSQACLGRKGLFSSPFLCWAPIFPSRPGSPSLFSQISLAEFLCWFLQPL